MLEKCGVVASGVVVVIAATPFRLTVSPGGIDKFIVRIDAASELRRSWCPCPSMLRWTSCVGIDARVLWLTVRECEARLGPVRLVILRRSDSSRTIGTIMDGGDWDNAPIEVEVLGLCV